MFYCKRRKKVYFRDYLLKGDVFVDGDEPAPQPQQIGKFPLELKS